MTPTDRVRATMPSISYGVPANAVGTLTVRLNIPNTADYDDARSQVRMVVLVQTPGTGVWVLAPKTGIWFGGFLPDRPPPVLEVPVIGPLSAPDALGQQVPLYDMRGTAIRVELEVVRAMRLGASVTSRVPQP